MFNDVFLVLLILLYININININKYIYIFRKKRKASTLLSSTSSIKTVTTTLHRCCDSPLRLSPSPSSVSPTLSYSVRLFSAADILFRLTEDFVGQVEEVQKNCFRKVRENQKRKLKSNQEEFFFFSFWQIMNSRYSKQENSSIYSSNRSRRQQSIPFNQQSFSRSHSDQIPKTRCFCWCCCCSCLW